MRDNIHELCEIFEKSFVRAIEDFTHDLVNLNEFLKDPDAFLKRVMRKAQETLDGLDEDD